MKIDDCQDCGERREGFARPWVCSRRGPLNPHTCYDCHDRLDAEAEAEREAAREQAHREAQITEQDRHDFAREHAGEW